MLDKIRGYLVQVINQANQLIGGARRLLGLMLIRCFGKFHNRTLGTLYIITGILGFAGANPAVMKSCYLVIGLVYVLHHGR